MWSRLRSERGGVTIELLGSFPIWLLLLLIFVQTVQVGRAAVKAETAAVYAARALAKGNDPELAARRSAGPFFLRLDHAEQAGCEVRVEVTMKAPVVLGWLEGLTIPVHSSSVTWPSETAGC